VQLDEAVSIAELARIEILAGVPPTIALGMLEHCAVHGLSPGAQLLERGEVIPWMYFILHGRLAVHLEEPPSDPNTYLEAGQLVGEMGVIDGSPATTWVVVTDEAKLLAIDDETFWRLVGASHQFAVNMLLLLARRVRANNTEIERFALNQRALERDASVDSLTGLFNRRWWNDRFERLVERAHRSELALSLMILDADHFKLFNDHFGHIAGDEVLKAIGRTLSENLRPTDLAARYGGEELVVALPGTDLVGARVAAERIRTAVSGIALADGRGSTLPQVTVSIGVATLEPNEAAAALFSRADAALYRAKNAGRNRIAW